MEQTMSDSTLARAQAGDSDAFAELTDTYRRELHVHCYRILGSFQDAEDVLQETLLSAWQALGRFDGQSLRAWLYRIATNRCLNYLRDASLRPQAANVTGAAFPFGAASPSEEPWWLEPYPDALIDEITLGPEARYDARESIGLSFIAGLQNLPTQQRTALVLRDVLGFSAAETAEMLESTTASVNSALQRARLGFRPSGDPDRIALPRSSQEAEVVARFVNAFERGDIDAVVALLTDDAKVTMPPEPFEFHGPQAIAEFYRSQGFWGLGVKMVATRANDQPALGYYLPDPNAGVHRSAGLLVLSVSEDRVAAIARFGDRSLLARFGLPRTLPSTP
jgi:RNA polymerase sigma-70 factor (TIGR02960 family)